MKHLYGEDEVARREIPAARFAAIGWLVLVLVVGATAAWEWRMQGLGLRAGDLGDGPSDWMVERRKLAAGDHDGVVIVGSSRILFDTDLDVWEEMTGRRPIQLALPGTNPRPLLADIADDSDFDGLVLVGFAPDLYFMERFSYLPQFSEVIRSWRDESPSDRAGHALGRLLSQRLAFLDEAYRLAPLVERIEMPDPQGVRRPYLEVWKLSETSPGRQYRMWPRLVNDERLRDHARLVWGPFDGNGQPPEWIDRGVAETQEAVGKIRARGGEVAFVRAPSAGLYYEHELAAFPRRKTWDRLLRETGTFGIHFEDHPAMQGLEVPEWSHLTAESATRFTREYVRLLMEKFPGLRRQHDSTSDP